MAKIFAAATVISLFTKTPPTDTEIFALTSVGSIMGSLLGDYRRSSAHHEIAKRERQLKEIDKEEGR